MPCKRKWGEARQGRAGSRSWGSMWKEAGGLGRDGDEGHPRLQREVARRGPRTAFPPWVSPGLTHLTLEAPLQVGKPLSSPGPQHPRGHRLSHCPSRGPPMLGHPVKQVWCGKRGGVILNRIRRRSRGQDGGGGTLALRPHRVASPPDSRGFLLWGQLAPCLHCQRWWEEWQRPSNLGGAPQCIVPTINSPPCPASPGDREGP